MAKKGILNKTVRFHWKGVETVKMKYLLNESKEEPAKELDYRNDAERKFEKRRSHRAAAIRDHTLSM